MILAIQTNIAGHLHIWLTSETRQRHYQRRIQYHGSETFLAFIVLALKANRRTTKDIQQIIVVRGPGAFTAIRTGLVVANTLGWLQSIPVYGIISQELLTGAHLGWKPTARRYKAVRPWYGREPNITAPKAKQLEPVT